MQTLKTDKGKIYNVDFAAKSFDGSVTIVMFDDRRLSEMAYEFDGVERMEYYTDDVFKESFDGYSVLSAIIRTGIRNMVQISVMKPD